jgi:hypothetical protein
MELVQVKTVCPKATVVALRAHNRTMSFRMVRLVFINGGGWTPDAVAGARRGICSFLGVGVFILFALVWV